MSDTNSTKKRKSVKNIYNANTGFALMINLYVIKYIYYHISKAPCFIEENGHGVKSKSIPLYSHTYFPLSRQRLDRINKGSSFEITRREAESITTAYGIDIKYFKKENPLAFTIENIDETAWKCFYNSKYNVKYALPSDLEGNKKAIASSVNDALKELTEDWETTLERDDPVFAICHYFHYGVRFDKPNIITSLKKTLLEIPYTEWDKETPESLNEMAKLLRGHYNYVNSLATLNKLRTEQQNKRLKPNIQKPNKT